MEAVHQGNPYEGKPSFETVWAALQEAAAGMIFNKNEKAFALKNGFFLFLIERLK